MALEILSFRILSPVFGNSVYVWGSVISVFLGAMSAGYAFGGRLADRRPRATTLAELLLLAALAQTLFLSGAIATSNRLADTLGRHAWTPLYYGLSVPFHLATVEMFQLALEHLEPHGILMLNLAAPTSHPFVKAIHATVAQVFGQTYVFPVIGAPGTLLVASQDPRRLSRHTLLQRATKLDPRHTYEPTYSQVAGRLEPLGVDSANTTILRDAFAPVDRLLHFER